MSREIIETLTELCHQATELRNRAMNAETFDVRSGLSALMDIRSRALIALEGRIDLYLKISMPMTNWQPREPERFSVVRVTTDLANMPASEHRYQLGEICDRLVEQMSSIAQTLATDVAPLDDEPAGEHWKPLPPRPDRGDARIAAWTAAKTLWHGKIPDKSATVLTEAINRWLDKSAHNHIEGRVKQTVDVDTVKRALGLRRN